MKRARPRRTASDKARLMREFEKSTNKQAFIREHGLGKGTMYRWRRTTNGSGNVADADSGATFTEAVASSYATRVAKEADLNKLREDNELLRGLVRRAIGNGFLRDFFFE